MATTYNRVCIKNWEITAENGDYFRVDRGKEYLTSAERDDGKVIVFGRYWVPVPLDCFAGEEKFT